MTMWQKHKRKTPSQAFTRSKKIYPIGRSLKFCGTVHCERARTFLEVNELLDVFGGDRGFALNSRLAQKVERLAAVPHDVQGCIQLRHRHLLVVVFWGGEGVLVVIWWPTTTVLSFNTSDRLLLLLL